MKLLTAIAFVSSLICAAFQIFELNNWHGAFGWILLAFAQLTELVYNQKGC